MGGCCGCFRSRKPPRENPSESPSESLLVQHKQNYATSSYHHQSPPAIASAGKGLDAAAARLRTGFQRFRTTIYDKNPKLFEWLKTGQKPKYMVFACSDSRVCPTLTLGLNPGEASTVRNIAGLVPAYHQTRQCSVGSAIEFAVVVLKVECVVVIGHSRCGGIRELMSLDERGPHSLQFIEDWVKIGMDAKRKVQRENVLLPFDGQCTLLEKEAVNLSLRNLKTYPFVKQRLHVSASIPSTGPATKEGSPTTRQHRNVKPSPQNTGSEKPSPQNTGSEWVRATTTTT